MKNTLIVFLLVVVALSSVTVVILTPKNVPYSRMLESTVLIEIDGRHTGSGFVVSSELIVTARHVVDREGEYAVVFSDGTKRNVQAIRISEASDCAVLLVRKANLRPLILTTEIRIGQPIFVVGSPIDRIFFNYVTHGIVSKINITYDRLSDNPLIMVDAAANPGNSGGPVFDLRGRVIGILIAGYRHNCGINFITPSADLLVLLEGWRDESSNWDEHMEEVEEYTYADDS